MNDIEKLIKNNIIKKQTILTVIYLKKYMDSVQMKYVEDKFIVNKTKNNKIYATCVNDIFESEIKHDDIILVDGMEISRLVAAYKLK